VTASLARKIGSALFILVVWQALVQTGNLNELFLPAPLSVLKAMWALTLSGTVFASGEAFPAEVDRRDNALPIVRTSVGLSHSSLNRAVYDRARDWVLAALQIVFSILNIIGIARWLL